MAGNKYIRLQSGVFVEDTGLQSSAGAGSAGELVALNSAGAVDFTMLPTTPGARVYRSTNQNITTSTGTVITFDSERYDTDTLHSTVSNTSRLTASRAGKYAISCHVEWTSNSTGGRWVRLLLNGATVIAQDFRLGASSSTDALNMSLSTIYTLAASDYVEVQVWHNRGSGLNVLSSANYSPEFAIQWLAP